MPLGQGSSTMQSVTSGSQINLQNYSGRHEECSDSQESEFGQQNEAPASQNLPDNGAEDQGDSDSESPPRRHGRRVVHHVATPMRPNK